MCYNEIKDQVKDVNNKNNKWKKKQKTKGKEDRSDTQPIAKVWELTDFVVRLS